MAVHFFTRMVKNTGFRRFLMTLAAFSLLFEFGCSQQTTQEYAENQESTEPYIINDCTNLILERRIRRSEYVAGKPGQLLEMHLKNASAKDINIREWFRQEAYNVKVFYAPCAFGKSEELKEEDWIQVHPDPKFNRSTFLRTFLTLNPGNRVLVDAPLVFLEKFQIPAGQKKVHIALRAELNLNSAKAVTPQYEVDIVPAVQDYFTGKKKQSRK